MDPFRDELAAAHAKIAQLEERIRYLEKALDAAHKAPTPPPKLVRAAQPPKLSVILAVFAISFVFAGLGGFVVIAAARSAKVTSVPAVSSASFNGIATAAPDDRNAKITPVIAPGAVASSSSKPTSKPPCNCQVGDPLCTCL